MKVYFFSKNKFLRKEICKEWFVHAIARADDHHYSCHFLAVSQKKVNGSVFNIELQLQLGGSLGTQEARARVAWDISWVFFMLSNLLLATITQQYKLRLSFTIILLNLKKIDTYIRNFIVESWREMAECQFINMVKTRKNKINSIIIFFSSQIEILPQYFKIIIIFNKKYTIFSFLHYKLTFFFFLSFFSFSFSSLSSSSSLLLISSSSIFSLSSGVLR